MNLPNKLTLSRILLVPVFVFFIEVPMNYGYFYALAVYCLASITDFFDGYIARKYNQITDFGKFVDPLADKILTSTAFIYLAVAGLCPPLVLSIILAREFAVSGVRMMASGKGVVIAAKFWGKLKTVLMIVVTVLALFFEGLYKEGIFQLQGYEMYINGAMWVIAAITVISGLEYILPFTKQLQ